MAWLVQYHCVRLSCICRHCIGWRHASPCSGRSARRGGNRARILWFTFIAELPNVYGKKIAIFGCNKFIGDLLKSFGAKLSFIREIKDINTSFDYLISDNFLLEKCSSEELLDIVKKYGSNAKVYGILRNTESLIVPNEYKLSIIAANSYSNEIKDKFNIKDKLVVISK